MQQPAATMAAEPMLTAASDEPVSALRQNVTLNLQDKLLKELGNDQALGDVRRWLVDEPTILRSDDHTTGDGIAVDLAAGPSRFYSNTTNPSRFRIGGQPSQRNRNER
jgi:hypothetical protein